MKQEAFEVLIVGAGPAGLSAALILGRCCRNVLVIDDGKPRNAASDAMHGYLGCDGIDPRKFLEESWREVERYPCVRRWEGHVDTIEIAASGFAAVLSDGRTATGRKLLLATGIVDELPRIEGIERFFGKSVHHCPYCDGYEVRGKRIAVYGKGEHAIEMARALTCWTRDILVFIDGEDELAADAKAEMRLNGIELVGERLVCLEGKGTQLTHLVTQSGRKIESDALFFSTPTYQHSRLARSLGCKFTQRGGIACLRYQATDVPGLFAAGNAVKDVHLVIVAAGEGAKAAFGINKALTREDYTRRAAGGAPKPARDALNSSRHAASAPH